MTEMKAQVRREDKGQLSHIRCQHPTCKRHPRLRYINWVDGVPIGDCCIKKQYMRLDKWMSCAAQ